MLRALLAATLLLAPCALADDEEDAPAPPPRTGRPVPQLKKVPKVNGALKDLEPGLALTPQPAGAWTGNVALHKDTLYVGVSLVDDRLLSGDVLEVSVSFPGAGTTAGGYVWRFAPEGLRAAEPGILPAHAHKLAKAAVVPVEGGLAVELGLPARALPRFPAREPLVFDLCVRFEDRDGPAASPKVSENCQGGTMREAPLRLPDDFRKALKLKPPEAVIGLEGREGGWVGFAVLHYPVWVRADQALTPPLLRGLATESPVDAKKAGIILPDVLLLPDKRQVVPVLSGKDPYAAEGGCDSDRELRAAFYLVKKQEATRVLEWPVSSCALGRATVELSDEGELTLGYTNGATVTFVWSGDHFERTEIGSR